MSLVYCQTSDSRLSVVLSSTSQYNVVCEYKLRLEVLKFAKVVHSCMREQSRAMKQ